MMTIELLHHELVVRRQRAWGVVYPAALRLPEEG